MGWLISDNLTKEQQIAALLQPWKSPRSVDGKYIECEPLDHSLRGNTLYVLWSRTDSLHEIANHCSPTLAAVRTHTYIAVYLLRGRGAGWGYKALSESEHPYRYDCPLKFLDRAPVANLAWREGVREYHATQRARARERIKIGDTVKLKPGITVLGDPLTEAEVLAKSGRGYLVDVGNGMPAKIMRRHIEKVL